MKLHPRLQQDCHVLETSPFGIVLLHRNASIPWFILVPDTPKNALFQMPADQRIKTHDEWNALAAWVHNRFQCERINMAAIGNLVPQLHLHVIARNQSDPLWPGVVWGKELPDLAWTNEEVAELATALAQRSK